MATAASSYDPANPPRSPLLVRSYYSFMRAGHHYLDKTTIFYKTRWLFFVAVVALYVFRVTYWTSGFFIVTYALGIYMLNLLIGFLSPQVDPETEVDDFFSLPQTSKRGGEDDKEEFRPFQRRLPEYKFWLCGSRAVLLSFSITFFPFFDLPVFWPILLVYFLLLFFLTMKQQVKKMIKYRYLPFSWGKQTYGDITRGGGSPHQQQRSNPPSPSPSSSSSSNVVRPHHMQHHIQPPQHLVGGIPLVGAPTAAAHCQ
eukprot:GHVS01012662.1.p1 GENE.GHVS01012662.1~~GHVS01012662.1.p1  ORF type:complete len:256 (-),score=62.08 GHVS01012662.1:208-975(-)